MPWRSRLAVVVLLLSPGVAFASDFGGMLSFLTLLYVVPVAAVLTLLVSAGKPSETRWVLWTLTTLGWLGLAGVGFVDRRASDEPSKEGVALVAIAGAFVVAAAIRCGFWIRDARRQPAEDSPPPGP